VHPRAILWRNQVRGTDQETQCKRCSDGGGCSGDGSERPVHPLQTAGGHQAHGQVCLSGLPGQTPVLHTLRQKLLKQSFTIHISMWLAFNRRMCANIMVVKIQPRWLNLVKNYNQDFDVQFVVGFITSSFVLFIVA